MQCVTDILKEENIIPIAGSNGAVAYAEVQGMGGSLHTVILRYQEETERLLGQWVWCAVDGKKTSPFMGGATFRQAMWDLYFRADAPNLFKCPTLEPLGKALNDNAKAFSRIIVEDCANCKEDPESNPQQYGGFDPYVFDTEYLLEGLPEGFKWVGAQDDDRAQQLCLCCYNEKEAQDNARKESSMQVLNLPDEARRALLEMSSPSRETLVLSVSEYGDCWYDITVHGTELLVWGYRNNFQDTLEQAMHEVWPEGHPASFDDPAVIGEEKGMTPEEALASYEEGGAYFDGYWNLNDRWISSDEIFISEVH